MNCYYTANVQQRLYLVFKALSARTNRIKRSASMKKPYSFKQLPKTLYGLILLAGMVTSSTANDKLALEGINLNNAETKKDRVSVDGFSLLNTDGTPIVGNSTGDLVLFIYDPSGTTRRKKSFLLDLSLQDKDSDINDLTFKNILAAQGQLTIENEDLTDFIQSSKDVTQLLWQIFVINNQFVRGDKFGDIDLINFGLATTELQNRKGPVDIQQLHQSKAHRTKLILENIDYGLESNGSLITYTGESASYNKQLHKYLADGSQTVGRIDQILRFGAHSLELSEVDEKNGRGFTTTYQYIGDFVLKYNKSKTSWRLIFTSKR